MQQRAREGSMDQKDQAKELFSFLRDVRRLGGAASKDACARFVLAFQALATKHVTCFAEEFWGRGGRFHPQPEATQLMNAANDLMSLAPPGTKIPTVVLVVSETPDDRDARRTFFVFSQLV